ncbi:head-tail connector protein [Latilactobacillus curvatus]
MTKVKLSDELNVDQQSEDVTTINELVSDAELIIQNSVDHTVPLEQYQKSAIFNRAAKTLATQLYYDRELSAGMSNGLQMMINHLKGMKLDAETS